MTWLREIGLEAIGAWNAVLGRGCVEGALERGLDVLGPHDQEQRTPTTAIVCIDSHGVEAALRREGILASARGPVIRLAPHFYNTLEDVERSLDALARVLDE
jgi:selenocysteine lyase/cysteine desulfurase